VSAEVLALVPARGGSKGIPRKNVIPIAGRPLIAWTIEQARTTRLITRVIVSTDDDEIAGVARDWGAEVPFRRPAELAQDLSSDLEVFRHALEWLDRHEGYRPELVVHLRATGPVRRVDLIDDAIGRMLARPDADSLRAVSWPLQTPYKMWRIDENGWLESLLRVPGLPEAHSLPRQQLPEVYWQNGYVDVLRPRVIFEHGSMVGHRILPFVVNEPMYELDYPESVAVVEKALRQLTSSGQLPRPQGGVERHPV
jgi:CMP-N,N'-diacetyllegionaminic acid synthase